MAPIEPCPSERALTFQSLRHAEAGDEDRGNRGRQRQQGGAKSEKRLSQAGGVGGRKATGDDNGGGDRDRCAGNEGEREDTERGAERRCPDAEQARSLPAPVLAEGADERADRGKEEAPGERQQEGLGRDGVTATPSPNPCAVRCSGTNLAAEPAINA